VVSDGVAGGHGGIVSLHVARVEPRLGATLKPASPATVTYASPSRMMASTRQGTAVHLPKPEMLPLPRMPVPHPFHAPPPRRWMCVPSADAALRSPMSSARARHRRPSAFQADAPIRGARTRCLWPVCVRRGVRFDPLASVTTDVSLGCQTINGWAGGARARLASRVGWPVTGPEQLKRRSVHLDNSIAVFDVEAWQPVRTPGELGKRLPTFHIAAHSS
jgi:hypothetical protein